MKANEIRPLVENIHQSPYKNIMIDGAWGIGKSYEIQKALKKDSESCILSLFGINNCRELFYSLVFKLNFKNKTFEKAYKGTTAIVKAILGRVGVKDAFAGAPKEATFLLLKRRAVEKYIIIFDDLERVGRDFNFEEFFGIIEELKQLDGIKIILIANTDKFNEVNKEVYDKYHEKVIDKIYKIEELSSNIDWENIGVEDSFFTEEYIENFNITNLRTIQKAEQFFKDVKQKIGEQVFKEIDNGSIKRKSFWENIKKICYSIVVEDIEKLGKEKLKHQIDGESSDMRFYYEKALDNFYKIVAKHYLEEPKGDIFGPIIKMLCDYYKNNDFDIEYIKDGIKLNKKMGEKQNFFKSDDELKNMLETVKKEFSDSDNFSEALKQADIIIIWMDVLEIDSTDFLNQMKEKLEKLLDDTIDKNIEIDEFKEIWFLNSDKLKEYTQEIFDSMDKRTFEKHISAIKVFEKSGDYGKAYMKLRDISNRDWKGVEENKLKELLIPKILPLGSISEEHWRMFRELNKLFIKTDEMKKIWFEYIKDAIEKNKSDKAFLNRMKSIDDKKSVN